MPSIESNRRIIGRGILQLYSTDEGGGNMIDTGSVISNGSTKNYNIGFRPKVVLVSTEDTTAYKRQNTNIFTEDGYLDLYDYDVRDINNVVRVVAKQRIFTVPATRLIEFTDTGFSLSIREGLGFYIALG